MTRVITVDRHDSPSPSGGICTTVRDLARFGQMVLQDGFANGRQIVPGAWIDDTRFGGDVEAFARNIEHEVGRPGGAYRNFWWITNDEHSTSPAVASTASISGSTRPSAS